MRLFDRIVESIPEVPQAQNFAQTVALAARDEAMHTGMIVNRLMKAVSLAVVVDATNVADLVGQQDAVPRLADLPVITPPYPMLFVEAKTPTGDTGALLPPFREVGILLTTSEITTEEERISTAMQRKISTGLGQTLASAQASLPDLLRSSVSPISSDVRWTTRAKLFTYADGKVSPAPWHWILDIDKEGKYIGGGQPLIGWDIPQAETVLSEQAVHDHFAVVLAWAMFTVSLMHAKNVEMVEVRSTKPPKKSVRRRRPEGRTTYYVLNVKPLSSRHKSESTHGNGNPETHYSLHLCRGHFKSYAEGNGLFGRLHGTYWWEAQARGREKVGRVDKDYNIDLPTA